MPHPPLFYLLPWWKEFVHTGSPPMPPATSPKLARRGSSSLWSRTFKTMSWTIFISWFSPAFGYRDRKVAYVPLSPMCVRIKEEKAGKFYSEVPQMNDVACRSPHLFLSDGMSMNFLDDCDFLGLGEWQRDGFLQAALLYTVTVWCLLLGPSHPQRNTLNWASTVMP